MTRFAEVTSILDGWILQQPWLPAQTQKPAGPDAVFVRDLRGRVRLIVNWKHTHHQRPTLDTAALHLALGAFSPGEQHILWYRDFLEEEARAVFESEDLRSLRASPDIRLQERQLIGVDWLRIAHVTPSIPRLSFFGLKGGVGRSTALATLAAHLAAQGKRVLAVDLDWESPGLGSMLLAPDAAPEHGIVDWFVEDLVGQADDSLLVTSYGVTETGVVVCPAFGKDDPTCLDKLSRAYVEAGNHSIDKGGFTGALRRCLDALEAKHQPDITLIDSRAGLHDLAAAALTQLGAEAMIFAADTRQNWDGLKALFTHWAKRPEALRAFRERIHLVQAMSPLVERRKSEEQFKAKAFSLFVDTIYEEDTGQPDAWNFDQADTNAPHAAVSIQWNEFAQQADPGMFPHQLEDPNVRAAFVDFVASATALAFPQPY